MNSELGIEVGQVATAAALDSFAATAAADARRLVVGALITDGAGRIYVQRRSLNRDLFPGCWDLVGGHAEAGETVEAALAREVLEETGWRLIELGPVVELIDWQAGGVARREIDLLVRVAGNLDRPRLEVSKHTEGRWLKSSDTALLLASRDPDDRWVFEVVQRAFAQLASWPQRPGGA